MGDQASPPQRTLPSPFDTSLEPFTLVTQGAEALLYKTTFFSSDQPAALKVRPTKAWRHPTLDKRLTRQRILAEARVLVKCRKEGVPVPSMLAVDCEGGWTVAEWIEGITVKEAIRQRRAESGEDELNGLLERIGKAVGKLHSVGVIHGDLTTSNMMLRPNANSGTQSGHLQGDIVLIDFGLATQAVQEEDRAVDLYVLERAFGSTHPREEGKFDEVLKACEEGTETAGRCQNERAQKEHDRLNSSLLYDHKLDAGFEMLDASISGQQATELRAGARRVQIVEFDAGKSAPVKDVEGAIRRSEAGVHVVVVYGAGHHRQNDFQLDVGAKALLDFAL